VNQNLNTGATLVDRKSNRFRIHFWNRSKEKYNIALDGCDVPISEKPALQALSGRVKAMDCQKPVTRFKNLDQGFSTFVQTLSGATT
jgi:hypothetical protein